MYAAKIDIEIILIITVIILLARLLALGIFTTEGITIKIIIRVILIIVITLKIEPSGNPEIYKIH